MYIYTGSSEHLISVFLSKHAAWADPLSNGTTHVSYLYPVSAPWLSYYLGGKLHLVMTHWFSHRYYTNNTIIILIIKY